MKYLLIAILGFATGAVVGKLAQKPAPLPEPTPAPMVEPATPKPDWRLDPERKTRLDEPTKRALPRMH